MKVKSPLTIALAFVAFCALLGVSLVITSYYKLCFIDEPLLDAAQLGDLHRVKELVLRGAEVDVAIDGSGPTPLELALQSEHYDVAEYLIEHGADLERVGDTSLITGNQRIFKLAKSKGWTIHSPGSIPSKP